ncbi:cytochrome P450 6B5-like [Plodia interpunctella]|uniref:cytochrome P450 6B5-like n=1 Tax=Plodia interpunctella TaxID=58824 RepID=UPI002368267D|nr:cytochrome P450 6B5-like [Plodia interpunctella]
MLVPFILLLCATCWLIIYLIGQHNEKYWKKKGLKFHQKNKVTGVFGEFLTSDKAMFKIISDIYKKYRNEPAVGIGGFLTPTLLVNDETNIQNVLQTDFNSFNHRGFEINEGDHLADNLVFMKGNRWKLVRQSMTPVFTSAKLKKMFYIMDKSGKDFVSYVKDNPEILKNQPYETVSTFCCAAIGAAVFGIVSESVFESPFLDIARRALKPSVRNALKLAIVNLSPWLSNILNIKLFSDYESFFIGAMKRLIRQREKESGQKHDFADICVSLQKNGTLKDSETGLELEPTDELLSGQAFFFFIAGVDPSAAAIYACLLQLGRHPEHLEKVHKEIDMAFDKLNGQLTFESVMEMEHLEKVLCESLRLLPPIGSLVRQCIKDTVLPIGNIKIEKGTKVFVSVYDLHNDPKYYPNPEIFDPERFASEAARNGHMYMPFGKGNRQCIGIRFARLQVKTGLIHFLRHYSVKAKIDGRELRFRKEQVQVRTSNVEIEFIPRKIKNL